MSTGARQSDQPVVGYLLDTNITTPIWDAGHTRHAVIRQRIEAELGLDAELYVSVLSIGECEDGLATFNSRLNEQQKALIRRAFREHRLLVDVDRHVAETYGALRAALLEKYVPKTYHKRRKRVRPESILDPVTSEELMIQENDLWLYATAVSKRLCLVTTDRKLRERITPIVSAVDADYPYEPIVWTFPALNNTSGDGDGAAGE